MQLTASERTSGRLGVARHDEATAAFRDRGFLEVGGLFPADTIRRLAGPLLSQFTRCAREDPPRYDKVGDSRYMLAVELEPPFDDPAVLGNPIALSLLRDWLPDVVLSSFGAVVALPGADAQHVHVDHVPLYPDDRAAARALPPYAVTMVVPLCPLDARNGSTRVYPGSHRDPEIAGVPGHDPVTALGDAYFMDYRLVHHGQPNASQDVRSILYLVYARPWFVDAVNYGNRRVVLASGGRAREVLDGLGLLRPGN